MNLPQVNAPRPPPAKLNPAIMQLWNAARDNPMGIWVRVTSRKDFTPVLYQQRRDYGGGQFDDYIIKAAPNDPDHEIWIVYAPKADANAR